MFQQTIFFLQTVLKNGGTHFVLLCAAYTVQNVSPKMIIFKAHIGHFTRKCPFKFSFTSSITHLLLPICVTWCGNYGRVKMMCYAAFCCKMQLLQKKVRGESYFKPVRKRNLKVCASPMFLLIWRARDKIWMLFLYTFSWMYVTNNG